MTGLRFGIANKLHGSKNMKVKGFIQGGFKK